MLAARLDAAVSALVAFSVSCASHPPVVRNAGTTGGVAVAAQPHDEGGDEPSQTDLPSYAAERKGPAYLPDWPEGKEPPRGYQWQHVANRPPIITGACVLGIAWFLSADAVAATHYFGKVHDTNTNWLLVPVMGPFIAGSYTSSGRGLELAMADGIIQAGGAALFVWGLASPRTKVVRSDLGTVRVLPTPLPVGRNGTGLGLVGEF